MTQVRKTCVQSTLSSIIFLTLNICEVPVKLTGPLGHFENCDFEQLKVGCSCKECYNLILHSLRYKSQEQTSQFMIFSEWKIKLSMLSYRYNQDL